MRIIGPPSADKAVVASALAAKPINTRFLGEMFDPLWTAAVAHTIDPVCMIAQAYKETAGGEFTGRVKPEHRNTCGLKVRYQNAYPGITDGDNPLAHAMFASWEVGATAHAQHLRAYAGWALPGDALIVDPRYTYVIGKRRCETFAELGGLWAPSETYGQEVEFIARQLQGTG